jgi:predicted CXXCH cytochrome family protein
MIRLVAIVALLLTAPWALAEIQRPTAPVKNCTEAGCHAKEIGYKVLHGPTALGACDVCHVPNDVQKHTFSFKQDPGKNLCSFCHVEKKTGLVTHKPVEEGKCVGCHSPHGGSTKSLLRKDDTASLCASCHKDITQGRHQIHGPVASGSCLACHNAHRGDLPKLLVAKGRDLCLGCHDQMGKQLKLVKTVHKPVEGDCMQCHEVHASDHMMQLKQEPADLCVGCHKPVKQQMVSAKFKHSALTDGKGCLNCHMAHGSDMAKLTRDDLGKACLTCHDKPQTTADKRLVAAVPEVGNKNLSLHGPIRDGNCAGCHALHGSENSRLLAKPYSEAFYEPFALEKYSLCFQCHDKALVLTAKTTGLTNFRNGEDSLHYLHVNKAEKGRSCRACHSTHASEHPLHIRDAVPFGKWELPINFQPTKTGGSCTPGCHKEASYDRENPVKRAAPTTPPAPATRPVAAPLAGSQVDAARREGAAPAEPRLTGRLALPVAQTDAGRSTSTTSLSPVPGTAGVSPASSSQSAAAIPAPPASGGALSEATKP